MKLEVAVAEVSQSKKDLTIEVAADEVKAEFDKAYEAYMRYAKVPGFRPGRVPRGVVKQRFAKDVKDEVIGRLLPEALHRVIIDHNLHVVGDPHIDEVSVNEGESLKFRASVEVLPDFELREDKGFKLTKSVARVTDQDVEKVINHWRESSAEYVPVEDRPSQDGDFVSINLTGKYAEPAGEEDLAVEDVQVELGAAGVQDEFNQNLRGVKAGDVREFRVSYPEDFTSPGLAGKTLDFSATVVAVRSKELPEADDEFAKGIGEYESFDQMREKVRESLTHDSESRAETRLRDQLVDRLISQYDFEIPSSLLERQASDRVRELALMLMRSGVSLEAARQMKWDEQMKEARRQAEKDIRAALVVGRIGDREKIEVSDQETDTEIERMSVSTGEPLEQLRARLTKDEALSTIKNRLHFAKVLDFVIGNSEITVEEISAEEEEELRKMKPLLGIEPVDEIAAETAVEEQPAEQPAEQP